MARTRFAALLGSMVLLGLGASAVTAGAQTATSAAPAVRPALTAEEMEHFLLTARIVGTKGTRKGVTGSRRATLSDGRLTHDAHIQVVDEAQLHFQSRRGTELNFTDCYRFNIAAYRLAVLLGLDSVPMSVARYVQGKRAAVTWWIDDVLMDDEARNKPDAPALDPARTAGQIHVMRVFDRLIQNTDRNAGNLLWTTDGKMWMIDHTRAFRVDTRIPDPQRLYRCERQLLEKMRALTEQSLRQALGDTVTDGEVEALLVRRDTLVKLFDDLIAARGEAAVLYSLEAPASAAASR